MFFIAYKKPEIEHERAKEQLAVINGARNFTTASLPEYVKAYDLGLAHPDVLGIGIVISKQQLERCDSCFFEFFEMPFHSEELQDYIHKTQKPLVLPKRTEQVICSFPENSWNELRGEKIRSFMRWFIKWYQTPPRNFEYYIPPPSRDEIDKAVAQFIKDKYYYPGYH